MKLIRLASQVVAASLATATSTGQGFSPPTVLTQHGATRLATGDLDGDGIIDLAVGAVGTDDGGDFRGAMYVLFLNSDGTVKAHQKISDASGGLTRYSSTVTTATFSRSNSM